MGSCFLVIKEFKKVEAANCFEKSLHMSNRVLIGHNDESVSWEMRGYVHISAVRYFRVYSTCARIFKKLYGLN